MAYAAQTSVSSGKSREELEKILARYGASSFGYMTSPESASVLFEKDGRRIKFVIPLPDRTQRKFTHTEARGVPRSPEQIEDLYEQAVRQTWRALTLVVKAKLEAVDAGISEFEVEFYGQTLLPSGRTVYEETSVQVYDAIQNQGPLRLSIES